MTRLDEIKARLSKATPGPWQVFKPDASCPGIEAGKLSIVIWGQSNDDSGVRTGNADADLIANAPADIAFLIGEVERLQSAADARADGLEGR